MCGIAGIVNLCGGAVEPPRTSRLNDLIGASGCPRRGNLVSPDRSVAFGHRRLAIIDPGPGRYQPMLSAEARYVTICDGEIPNFLELGSELETLFHWWATTMCGRRIGFVEQAPLGDVLRHGMLARLV